MSCSEVCSFSYEKAFVAALAMKLVYLFLVVVIEYSDTHLAILFLPQAFQARVENPCASCVANLDTSDLLQL